MENKQGEKKKIEDVIVDWSIHSVILLIQGQDNFIATTAEQDKKEEYIGNELRIASFMHLFSLRFYYFIKFNQQSITPSDT